jgi:hypothetical protein
MTSKKLMLGTLAIVLAFGMTVSGCSKGSKSGGEADVISGGKPGTLTITGLPEQKYQVLVVSMDKDLSSVGRVAFAVGGQEATGDQLSSVGNVFDLVINKAGGGAWTGTGKRQVILIEVIGSSAWEAKNQAIRTATVNFSKGSATVKYSSFTAVTK